MEKGQSLVEVLVGLATAVIIIGAITIATISALNNATFSKNQNLATSYAQQGMEIVRNLRDRNSNLFSQLNSDYCLAKSCDKIDPTNSGPNGTNDPCGPVSIMCSQNVGGENADIFVRKVSVDPNSSDCKDTTGSTTQGTHVSVVVSWFDAKCGRTPTFCHNVTLSSCFSTYNIIQAQ